MIHFEIPKNQSSIIKVIGVGGGGSNAVNYMHELGIDGVDFVVCNTDSQALAQSPIPNKIQLGPHLTQGLGAGANPNIGKQAGEESIDDITKILKVNTRMAFITAGMGGGTGTGSAPIIAKVCHDLGILTVGIVTTPFAYEGRRRMLQATEGIEALKEHVDTILIISNDKLRQQFGNLPFSDAFSKADNVLSTAAKCITDLITVDGHVNLDFNDVQTVMKNGGRAILGSATAAGENRAMQAVEEALNSPLLNDSEIEGAKWLLLNITSSHGESEHTLDELEMIQAYVQQQAGHNCDIILGMGNDDNLGDKISVTIIATGFQEKEISADFSVAPKEEAEKVVVDLYGDKTPAKEEVEEIKIEKIVDPYAPKLMEIDVNKPYQAPAHTPAHTYMPETIALQPKPDIHIEQPQQVANQPQPATLAQSGVNDEERAAFEKQKQALEDRAERMRSMTFSVSGTDSHSEIESVPAYQRRNVDIQKGAEDKSLSGYRVGEDDSKVSGIINTINTFLYGKKPD